MNETDTPLTIGATEGTGDRKKKATKSKKTTLPGKSSAKASGKTGSVKPKKGTGKKTISSKKAGAGKKTNTSKASFPLQAPALTTARPGNLTQKKITKAKKPGKSRTTAGSVPAVAEPPAASVGGANEVLDLSTLKAFGDYGISRIDQEKKKNHGWYVRLGQKKKTADTKSTGLVIKWFSDRKCGGRDKGYRAAKSFRDEQFISLPDKLRKMGSKKRNAA